MKDILYTSRIGGWVQREMKEADWPFAVSFVIQSQPFFDFRDDFGDGRIGFFNRRHLLRHFLLGHLIFLASGHGSLLLFNLSHCRNKRVQHYRIETGPLDNGVAIFDQTG
uniref:Uncharacterized protein n=1 Tax=Cacopsylla melanoneura TaxID=428564 RepID=A0A8D8TI86_9HEMI